MPIDSRTASRLLVVLLALCAAAPPVAAQNAPNAFEEAFAHAFAELDLTETTTGVLAERGAYLLDPLPYDGSTEAPGLTRDRWGVLYAQFTHSYAATPAIPAVGQIEAAAEAVAAQGRVPIGVLWQPMDRLVAEAPETGEGLLELDGSQIVRPLMPGFARGSSAYAAPSPFEQTQFFGAAVLADGVGGVPQVGNYATFVLDPSLFVVADGASISDVRVDLGTGAGYQPVTLGQPISASYPSARRVTGRVRARIGGVVRYAAFTFDAGAATTARLASDGPPPDIASRPVAR